MRPLLLALPALFLVACSGSSEASRFDAARGVTVYESRPVDLGRPAGGGGALGGIGGSGSITLQAAAECAGGGCVPDEYQLSLSISGESSVSTDYTSIAFETDEGTVTVNNEQAGSRGSMFSTSQGEFFRLTVPEHIFRSFATARTLTVRLGGSAYQLGYDRRHALRRILVEEEG